MTAYYAGCHACSTCVLTGVREVCSVCVYCTQRSWWQAVFSLGFTIQVVQKNKQKKIRVHCCMHVMEIMCGRKYVVTRVLVKRGKKETVMTAIWW